MVERVTAYLWLALASLGIVIRCRRLWIFRQWHYDNPDDQLYLRGIIRSSWLRLGVKVTLMLGGLLAVTNGALSWTAKTGIPDGDVGMLFWGWRAAVLVSLTLLTLEDLGVERMRANLGRPVPDPVTAEHLASYRQMADEAIARLEQAAAVYRREHGEAAMPTMADVLPEHQSPITDAARKIADIATLRARLVAAALGLRQRPRPPGEAER